MRERRPFYELPPEEIEKNNMANRNDSARRSLLGLNTGTQRTYADEPADHELLRRENDQQIADLANKVGRIKQISNDISIQVQESNRELDELDNSMSTVRGLLSGSMKRLNRLVENSDSRHMCYLVLFVIAVLLIVFYLTKSAASAVTTPNTSHHNT